MTISADTPVREIVIEHPETIPELERLGIDYCCGGKHTLAEACAKLHLESAPVLEQLESQQKDPDMTDVQWQKAPLGELTEHIVHTHHSFAREQLGLIRDLASKVERRHGNKHPEVFQVSEALTAISTELSHHFFCEENLLFPYISQLGTGQEASLPPGFESAQQPISRMMLDHNHTGNELRLLREITHGYLPPADACTTYRALYRALEDLERDLHRHIHLENNILFPRALEQAGESA